MSVLVIAEHDNHTLGAQTANVISACRTNIDSDIHVLVAGQNCRAVAEQIIAYEGVTRVLVADNHAYCNQLPEVISLLVYGNCRGSCSNTFGGQRIR